MHILGEVGPLNLEGEVVKRAERLSVYLQDSFSDQVLTLRILVVANLFFNSKCIVPSPDDVLVGGETCEDGHLVDLKLFQSHEEVVNMAVLPLHYYFRDHSWKLLLLGWKQSRHRERVHRSLDEGCDNQLEHFALLYDEVVCLFLRVIYEFWAHAQPEQEASGI